MRIFSNFKKIMDMLTILVPIDFSATSKNAAKFATDMAGRQPGSRLIFFHLFDPIAAGSDGTPLDIDINTRKEVVLMGMQNLAREVGAPADTSLVAESGVFLIDNLASFVQQEGVDFVVMGLTGASALDHILMGSNALRMANEAVSPVLVVPPDASFKGLQTVVFTTDMKDVRISTPINQLKAFLSLQHPTLHVLHVGASNYEKDPAYTKEKADLQEMLAGFNPQFHFIHESDFVEAADAFARTHAVDCIITVPRHHSFIESIFVPHYTRRLAYHTHIPLLAIHE